MKRQYRWFEIPMVMCLLFCLAARSGFAADAAKAVPASFETESSPWEVGTRITHVILLDDTRGTENNGSFVGTITKLKAAQDYAPYKLYVQYRVQEYVAVGVSYDRFGAEAWEQASAHRPNPATDGTTWLSGPLFYVSGRYLNDTRFTPYAELGLAYYFASFDYNAGWGHIAGVKEFILDDTTGFFLAGGCEARFDKNWSADVYMRYMNVDVDGIYNAPGQQDEDIIFTMSHLALGIGVKYTF